MFNKPSLAKDGHKIKKFNSLYIVWPCICRVYTCMCIIPYLINMIGLYMNNYRVSMVFSNEERGGGGYTINSKKIVNMKQL